MQRNTIIALALGALLVGVGGYTVYTSMQAKPYGGEKGKGTESSNGYQAGAPSSLKELLASTAVLSCTFDDEQDGVDSEGTAYIANGKVRVDYATTTAGKTESGSMIIDGNTSYLWSANESTGFKMTIDPTSESSVPSGQSSGIDPEKEVNYSCTPWIVDTGKFTPPSTVEFTDFAGMMQTVPAGSGIEVDASDNPVSGSSPDLKAMQCSACLALPDASEQAQCRAAIGC